ncbi:MAG: hypothetical protein ACUVTD_01570 [Nitrososphaerales archaeon]
MSSIAHTFSVDGKKIHISAKTWSHVIEEHDEMAGNIDLVLETVNDPDFILHGTTEEKVATKFFPRTNVGPKYIVVPYKETSNTEGFIITSYMMSKRRFSRFLKRRGVMWHRQ